MAMPKRDSKTGRFIKRAERKVERELKLKPSGRERERKRSGARVRRRGR